MKSVNLIFLFLILAGSSLIISAQTDVNDPPRDFPPPPRPNSQRSLLRELGLNQDQIQKIRGINQELRPKRQAAQKRLQEAKQILDQSVYSDNVEQSTIQTNLKNVIEAQGELIKLKTQQELAVRGILTPEQLIKFREIRSEFELRKKRREMRRNRMLKRRGDNPNP